MPSRLNFPDGATFANFLFKWTPSHDQAGVYRITFVADDGTGQASITVTVSIENVGPEITLAIPAGPAVLGVIDDTLRFMVEFVLPLDAVASFLWTVDGDTTAEAGSSYLHTVLGEEEVTITVSDGDEAVTRVWSVVLEFIGDYDGDFVVGFGDFLIFVAGFGSSEGDANYDERLDLVPNGRIDFDDFLSFVNHFGNRV